ncbi:hypothetical protein JCM24511_02562 [Saitozyma sp. JCM 24511]|nr:hypothetical protein JCM24511_02562 [Saitozyma sp. JCM 24511]
MPSSAQVTNALSRLRATSRSRLKSKGNRRKLLSPPTETPQGQVLDFPFEVAELIAEHLDDASARALCRTSTSLRVAGQLRLWRTLRVIADVPSRSEGGSRNQRRPTEVADEDEDDVYPVGEDTRGYEPHRMREELLYHPDRMRGQLLNAIRDLSEDPVRRSAICRLQLDLDLRESSAEACNGLLRLIGPTLQELRIRVRHVRDWWIDCRDEDWRVDLKGPHFFLSQDVEKEYIEAVIRHWQDILCGVEDFPHLARLTIFSTCSIEIDLRFMLRLTPKLAALRISGRVRRSRRLALEVSRAAQHPSSTEEFSHGASHPGPQREDPSRQ